MNVGPSSSIARRIRVSRLRWVSASPSRFLRKRFNEVEVEPGHPAGQAVLAEDREDFAPAIDVAIDLRDGGYFH